MMVFGGIGYIPTCFFATPNSRVMKKNILRHRALRAGGFFPQGGKRHDSGQFFVSQYKNRNYEYLNAFLAEI